MTIDRKRLGHAVRELRQRKGLTQVALARAAHLSESGNSVALIERGERGVSVELMNRLSDVLGVPAGCLALLGSKSESGHPRSQELLAALQDLIYKTLDAQAAMTGEHKAVGHTRRARPARSAAGV